MTELAFPDGRGSGFAGEPEPTMSLIWIQLVNWGRIVRLPSLLDEPKNWATDRVRHLVARINAKVRLRRAQHVGRVYAYGSLGLVNSGFVSLGDRVLFSGGPLRSHLKCHDGARLTIGDDSSFNYGIMVVARHGIAIGRGCQVATRVLIIDQIAESAGPIVIEDDVWIANGAAVLPGVRIGRGSVVSAGTVVDADVPPDSLVIGRPARRLPLATVAR